MGFVPMDPDKIRKLLEGEPDIIGLAVEQEREIFQNARCPACLEVGAEKRITAPKMVLNEHGLPELVSSPFSPDYPLARGYAHCLSCGTDYDLQSGLIVRDNLSMIHGPHSDLPQE